MPIGEALTSRPRRLIERLLAAISLTVLSPVICAAAVAIAREDGRPVFFVQERVGQYAVLFNVFKLRTMITDADAHLDSSGLPTRDRVTSVGKRLRRYGVDELPQLWNVARGEMSFIGPRPILPEYLDRLIPSDHPRFGVLPGITGTAQVAGRNSVPWSRRLELDAWYAKHQSMRVDMRILGDTIRILTRSAAVAPDRNSDQVMDLSPNTAVTSNAERSR